MDAAHAYQRRLIETATPIGLIVLLFERAVLALERAGAAMERNDIETRTAELNRALAIVAELKRSLNFERGGQVAHTFDRFYQMAERQIVTAACRRDRALIGQLQKQFCQIRDAWRQAEGKPAPALYQADPAANAAGEVRSAWRA